MKPGRRRREIFARVEKKQLIEITGGACGRRNENGCQTERDERGDLRYLVLVDCPNGLDEANQELLAQLEARAGEDAFVRVAAYGAALHALQTGKSLQAGAR